MNVSAERINNYQFQEGQRLFFDTNIWIFIYGAYNTLGDQSVKTYSKAWRKAKRAGAIIYIDGVVLGEFINRGLRDDHALLHPPGPGRVDFKTYRGSPEYAASVRAVAAIARQILAESQLIESAFASCDIEAEISKLENGQTDWSDQMIVALCHERDLILVTDDGDFGDSGLTILTRNSSYFPSASEIR